MAKETCDLSAVVWNIDKANIPYWTLNSYMYASLRCVTVSGDARNIHVIAPLYRWGVDELCTACVST